MIDHLLGGLNKLFLFIGLLLAAGAAAALVAGDRRRGCLRTVWIAAILAALYWLYRSGRIPFL